MFRMWCEPPEVSHNRVRGLRGRGEDTRRSQPSPRRPSGRKEDADTHSLFAPRPETDRARLAEQGFRLRTGHEADRHGTGQAVPGVRVRLVDGQRAGAGAEDSRRGQVRLH